MADAATTTSVIRAAIVRMVLATALIGSLGTQATAREGTAGKVFRGVSYVGMTVTDLEASADRYAQSADLEEVARGQLEHLEILDTVAGRKGVIARSRLLQSSNVQLRLMELVAAPDHAHSSRANLQAVPVNGPGFAHVCFRSDGDNATYQRFLENGATPVGKPEMVALSAAFPVLYAYALDPDGILFEVEHVDIDALTTRKPQPGFSHIRHVSLATPDIEQAVEFYSSLLAIPNPRRAGGDAGLSGEQFDQVSGLPGTRIKMAWFQVGNLELEVIQYLSHPTATPPKPRPLAAPGYNMVVFDVTNLDVAKQRLLEAGGTTVTNPEAMDGGQAFFGRDLDGNLLGFLVPAEGSAFSSSRFAAGSR